MNILNIYSKTVFAMLFLMTCLVADARTITGRVVKVSDGDTFTLLCEGNVRQRVRMYGIDAPEIKGGQPYARKSRQYLADMIAGQTVTVRVKDTDRYKRVLGIVSTARIEDVNLKMIQAGMAWHYSYFDNTPAYKEAEKEARACRRGLWQDKNPVNPYRWRKMKKNAAR